MTEQEIKAKIEAILFSVGDMVTVPMMAEAIGVEEDVIRSVAESLKSEWEEENRGIRIIRLVDGYQLTTSKDCFDAVQKVMEPRKRQVLSGSALEALSIIAYNQPVTKSTIEYIRGVDCTYVLNRLVERGLVEEAGRMNAPGKPILYRTTLEFLRCFGLESIEDLPELEQPLIQEEIPEQLEMV